MAGLDNYFHRIDPSAEKVFAITYGQRREDSRPPFGPIVDSTWSGSPEIIIHEESFTEDEALVKVSIPTGIVGQQYKLTNHVVTEGESANSEQDDASLVFKVVES